MTHLTSALKFSLKTAKDWTRGLGLAVLRLEDCTKTSCGGPVLLVKTSLLYPSNYPSKHI